MKKILKKIKKTIKHMIFYGKKYRCPCCEETFRRMFDFNYHYQVFNKEIYKGFYKNTICPECYSLPRHRIICEYLNHHLNEIEGKQILIFAPEMGTLRWMDDNHIKYITADLYAAADLKLDITEIDLKDESIDVVFCNHVLEHVEDYRKALRELNRILSKNGLLICTVPTDRISIDTIENQNLKTDEERKKTYGQSDHLRNFGINFPEIVEKYGFNVKVVDGGEYPEEIIPKIGPGKYDDNKIYIATKISDK